MKIYYIHIFENTIENSGSIMLKLTIVPTFYHSFYLIPFKNFFLFFISLHIVSVLIYIEKIIDRLNDFVRY